MNVVPPRLRRIGDIGSKYGQRVQYLVFEYRLSGARMARMKGEIEDAIDKECHSVNFCHFPRRVQASKPCLVGIASMNLGSRVCCSLGRANLRRSGNCCSFA